MRKWLGLVLLAFVSACGGGGGGGGASAIPGGTSGIVVTTPTATPFPAPAASGAPFSITAGTAAAVISLGSVANITAILSLNAVSAGGGTAVAQAFSTQPSTTPALQSSLRRPAAIGTSSLTPLLFVTFTPSVTLSFATTPAFAFAFTNVFALPVGISAYVAMYDPSNPNSGWQTFLGPAVSVPATTTIAPTLAFSSITRTVTFQANQTYVFALFQTLAGAGVIFPIVPPNTASGPIAGEATPGPAVAYMAAGLPANSFQSSIAVGSSAGEVVNVSGVTEIDNTPVTASPLPMGNVTVSAGPAVSAFFASRAVEAPLSATAAWQGPVLRNDTLESGARLAEISRRSAGALHVGTRAVQAFRRSQALGTAVGSTGSFSVDNAAIGTGGTSFQSVSATLLAVSSHGYIWIDNSLPVTTFQAQTIGFDFDNAYASDSAHFGSPEYTSSASEAQLSTAPCDASGNPIPGASPVPLIIPPPNGMHVVLVADEAHLGAGVGGYFDSVNHLTQGFANCLSGQPKSNEASMIVVSYNTNNTAGTELNEDLVRSTAHEFQHLINHVNHGIISQSGASEDRWINEGLSVLAQDFAVARLFPALHHDVDNALALVHQYFTQPSQYSLTGFIGIDPGSQTQQYNCSGCYGLSYLFQLYNYGRFGGDNYLHALETNNTVSTAGLQSATGISANQNIADFAVALMTTGRIVTTDRRYLFIDFDPYGIYPDQFGRALLLNGPAVFSITPGTAVTLTPFLGTFYYVQITTPGHTGAGITATDNAGNFALTSGLLQF